MAIMSYRAWLVVWLVGLGIGVGVVLVSLFMSSRNLDRNLGQGRLRRFYWSKEILPDHTLYPLVMGVDRLRLMQAPAAARPALTISSAQRRLESARALLAKDETLIALDTLVKGQKYLLEALELVAAGKGYGQLPQIETTFAAYQQTCEQIQISSSSAEEQLLSQLKLDAETINRQITELKRTER